MVETSELDLVRHRDCWQRPGVMLSFCNDRVCEWNINELAFKHTLLGKPGEFRNDNKTNRAKFSFKKEGVLKSYEFILVRWGFKAKRNRKNQSAAVSILFRFKGSKQLVVPEQWGGFDFEVGSWCMGFGEVVEWAGLYRFAATAGLSVSIIDNWIKIHTEILVL